MEPVGLNIPHPALSDAEAFEILRVWVAHKQQVVTIKTGIWEDPKIWGMMLADLAKHIALAFQQDEGRETDETLRLIRGGFDLELDHPTGNATSL